MIKIGYYGQNELLCFLCGFFNNIGKIEKIDCSKEYDIIICHEIPQEELIVNEKTIILFNADCYTMPNFNKGKMVVISYGINQKSTFTFSSIDENEGVICVQRNIWNINGKKIIPQEIPIKFKNNLNNSEQLCVAALSIICDIIAD